MSTLVASPKPIFDQIHLSRDLLPQQEYTRPRYLLEGKVQTWAGEASEVASPIFIDGQRFVLGREPKLTQEAALEALRSATRAYSQGRGFWPTLPVSERIRAVEHLVRRMRALREEAVRLLMWEIAKTRLDAETEFDRTIRYMEDTVHALKEIDRAGSRFVVESGFVAMIRRSPLGVSLCMGPFNYPLNETFGLLIPALLMGNTVIFKPPRFGVLIYQLLLEPFAECFPPGVLNSVSGDGETVIGPLMRGGEIDILAFIGSARVGALLKSAHPRPNRLRSVLGLGAKNAAIVLADADLDLAADECTAGAFSYNGQRCTAIKILFAQRQVAEECAARLAARVEALPLGLPWEPEVRITPLAEPGKPEWLRSLVEAAGSQGARVINRGGGASERSLYYPAVLYPASTNMEICSVEQFGPVLPIVPFDDPGEVLDWMAASSVGQQCSIFGRDPRAVADLIDPLVNQVCRVNLNSQCQRGPDTFPFGGRKDSAEGTLSVSDALRVFSIRSLVAGKATEGNQALLSRLVSERLSSFVSTDFIF
ncbi:MAG: aldehyde dehydrogenase family protein [Candidatus Eisenbacteria bacterium]|nr:aldehyde dehydrogenase family protein [Candidatus Eisenbacteria bacterium]